MKYLQKTLAIILCFVTVFTAVPLTGRAVDDQEQSTLNQENIQVQSNNTLGKEIGELMEEQQETENSDYCISWMDLEGKTATVEMVNKLACTVVVAVFEENGKMVGSGKTEVEAETAEATVELDIETMPEYFVAKAFLLDENMASLCDEYLCERYTREFQEFLDLTIHDFEDQIVVQFDDEEEDNNFVVAKDGTQESKQDGEKNILVSADDENGIYVFENADKTITGVSVGENLFYDLGDDNYILVKVASNVTEGNLTTVVADDAEIADLYDCIKIDTTANGSQAVVDTSTMHESLEMVETEPQLRKRAIDIEEEKKFKCSFIVSHQELNGNLEISGGFDLDVGIYLKLYYKTKGKNVLDFKIEAKYGYKYNIDVTAGINSSVNLPLSTISIPIYAGIFFDIKLSFNFSAKGTIGVEGYKNVTCGFTYNNSSGVRKIYSENENWVPTSKGLSFQVRISLDIEGAISVLKIIDARVVVGVGIILEGNFNKVDNKEGADKYHLCSYCCAGECFLFANLRIAIKFIGITLFDKPVVEKEKKLFDFYFSNISQGIFATCPHYLCKVTYVVTDNAGNKLKNIAVGDLVTDANGSCYDYCEPDNIFTINLNVDGYLPYSKTVNVRKSAVTVPIRLVLVQMTGISIKSLPTKTYYTGDTLDTSGIVLVANYNSGKTETITSGFTCSPTTLNTAGTQAVTVKYNGFTTNFYVPVIQTKATSLSVATVPNKVSYFVGDTLDTTGLVLSETYNNGDVKTITSGYTCTPTTLNNSGTQTITVKYGNRTCKYTVDVTPVVTTGVVVSTLPEKLSYFVGDTLDTSGLVLTETYNNGDVKTITSGYTCTPTTLDTSGTQTITVTYGENTCTFDVVVTPVVATKIIVSELPSKLDYRTGDTLDTSGLVLTEIYNNGDVKTITSGYTCTPTTLDTAGTQTITVTYGKNTCTFNVSVIRYVPISITVETLPEKIVYFVGDVLDTTGLVLTETYNTGDVKTVTSGYTCTPTTLDTAGKQTITVTYGSKTCTFDINVYDAGECSGTCGENLVWVFDPLSGLLTIKGTGEMYSWSSSSSYVPWYEYNDDIKTVKIEDGVTSIGNSAFGYCSNLTSVTISDSVTTIGNSAFYHCSRLTSVTIPDSVTSIGNSAFSYCTSLESVTISDSVTAIGNYAFNLCTSLESVTIPDSVTTIGNKAFYSCDSLTSVTIGKGVTTIEGNVFERCTQLTDVYYTGDIIGWCKINFSFYSNPMEYADNLYIDGVLVEGKLIIPDSVTSIGYHAFSGCTGLTSVTIPDSVTTIGALAFYGCSGLTSITIDDGVKIRIGDYAFAYCTGLTSVTIPGRETSIGRYVFEKCTELTSVTLLDGVISIDDSAFSGCKKLTSITIPNSVTYMGSSVFSGCTGLTNIIIPDSITSISNSLFLNAGLTSITIPDSVTIIGDGAFSDCTALTSITIPDSVTIIGDRAFSGCTALTSITIPNSVTSICDGAFSGCTGLTKITVPNSVISIGSSAFYDCRNLTSITIPNSVTSIGDWAFSGCTGLTKITIPNSVTSICDFAFSGCSGLTNITIPNSVTSICDGAFSDCTGLTKITIPNSVTSIGDWAFSDCTGLTSITIPNSVTSICNGAFSGCTGLTKITIPNSVTSIADNVFSGCTGLTSITLPSDVTHIGESAFYGCTGLTSIIIPKSITLIESYAFEFCRNLTDVYYSGTAEEWAKISISSRTNSYLTSATIHYNSTGPARASMSLRTIKPPIEGVPVNLSVITAQTSGAIVGNRYTLIALDQTEGEYDLNNLAFIDHTLATGTDVSFSFMPKSAENLIVLIIGDFGSGVEQRVISGAPGVAVTGISLSHTSLEFYPGQDAVQLTAYITPDEASIKDVIWTSSDESVASVDKNGVVTPYNPGTATITATSASDGISAECQVTVTARTFEIKWIMSDGIHTVEYDEGEAITEYENTDRTGYTFVGWDKTVPNRMPASNLEFKALYKANSYNATFDANGGQWADGTTVAKSVVADFDSDIPAQTEPTMQGFVFSGWEYNGENLGTNVGKMTSVDGMTFIAVWVPANDTRYTVKTYTMNENGEYILSEKVLSGTTNETATVSPEIENGFELNESKSVLSGKISADNSLVLSVYIDRKSYTFTTIVDGEETTVDYLYGAKVNEPTVPSKVGYSFSGWDSAVPQTMPAENVILTAQWQINTYTITWISYGNTTVKNVEYGAEIEIPVATEKPGHEFVKWDSAIPSTMPAQNLTFTAVYKAMINGFEIKQPSRTTIRHKDGIILHVNVEGTAPAGSYIEWTASNGKFKTEEINNGSSLKIVSNSNGKTTFTATLYSADGEVLATDSIEMNSKAGFFDKIGSFFRSIFGGTKIYEN